MKYLLGCLVTAILLFTNGAFADQRFETWQGLCHFAYDPNDADNEVYFANCKNTIDTYDAGDGNGRLAYGTAFVRQKYDLNDTTFPQVNGQHTYLKGDAVADTQWNERYVTSPNTACVMVTSNYDAGADDNNETVYTTNDWTLDMEWKPIPGTAKVWLNYHLNCKAAAAQ